METNISTSEYIKSQSWFRGARSETLFLFSLKINGQKKLMKEIYSIDPMEILLTPKSKTEYLRTFNTSSAKKFHLETLKKLKENPEIINDFLEVDNKSWEDILSLARILKLNIGKDNQVCISLLLQIIKKYEKVSTYFFILFSQGKVLTENKNDFKIELSGLIKSHDQWRNSVTYKEEELISIIQEFITSLKLNRNDIINYTTAYEFYDFLLGKLNISEIISGRKNNGYAFLGFNHSNNLIIDDKKNVDEIINYFGFIEEKSDKISGQTINNSYGKVIGRVILIPDKEDLINVNNSDIQNKIIVSKQTTPHFIVLIKKAKGIVTDEGGISCHAAIISREMNIPCIVGTKCATKILRTNDEIEIDTINGIIKILKKSK